MPKSALSDRLNDPENWKGTDDDQYKWMRWRIPLKGLFAYGPRATEWWAKWREWPKTLFAICGKGGFRLETETWERDSSKDCIYAERVAFNTGFYVQLPTENPDLIYYTKGYLSRVQYYSRWHLAIQWPLLIQFHFYFKASDVPEYGKPRPPLKNKLFFFYLGAHRDGDKVYWFPSAFVGLTWK